MMLVLRDSDGAAHRDPALRRRAMLETCGSAGKGASEGGCTFPVTES